MPEYSILVKLLLDNADTKTIQTQLNALGKTLKIIVTPELDEAAKKKLENQWTRWMNKLSTMKTAKPKVFNDVEVQKLVTEFMALEASFKAGEISVDNMRTSLNNLTTSYTNVSNGIKSTTKDGYGFTTMIGVALKKIAVWAIGTQALYGTLKEVQAAIKYIIDLNKELTNIQIVTGMSNRDIGKLAVSYNSLAKELGATTLDVAKGSLEWSRQGKTVAETTELLRASVMMAKLANLDQAQSTEYLTSIINGYKLSLDDVMPKIDALVALDNSYATSVGEIAEALQKVSAVSLQTGVSFEQMAAMITVVSSDTRVSAETIGQAFKTILMRMQNVKLGKFLDDEGNQISDVEKVLNSLGIELRDTNDQFRNMGDVLNDTMVVWNQLGAQGKTVEQAMLANAFAGQRQANIFTDLMNNQDKYTKALDVQANSLGLTTERYKIFNDNIEATKNKFTASWQEMWSNVISKEIIIGVYKLGIGFADLIKSLGGLIPSLVYALSLLTLLTTKKIGDFFINYAGTIWKAAGSLKDYIWALLGVDAAQKKVAASALLTNSNIYVMLAALAATGIMYAYLAIKADTYNKSMVGIYENFQKGSESVKDNQAELRSLADEYSRLASKTDKTAEDTLRLLDIQTILTSKYGLAKEGVNFYTAAIDGNSSAIKANIELIKDQARILAETYLASKKYDYEKAMGYLAEKPISKAIMKYDSYTGESSVVGSTVSSQTPVEQMEEMAAKITSLTQEDAAGNASIIKLLKQRYDIMGQELLAATKIKIEYESQQNILTNINAIKSGTSDGSVQGIAITVEEYENLNKAATEASGAFVTLADNTRTLILALDENNVATMSQVESLKNLFPEEYTQALIIEGDQIKLNTEALKGLVVAKATEALVSTQTALQIAITNSISAQSSLDTSIAVYEAARATVLSLTGVSAAYKGVAIASVDSANTQIAAARAQVDKTQASLIGAYDAVELAQAYLNQVSGAAFWTKELGAAASGAAGAVGSLSKEQSAYNDILKATISMIRQQKEAEKDALEEKLKNYKRTIDAHKKLLDQKKDEKEFDDDVAENNKKIADIDNELLELQFDNSEEAQARKLELAQEKVDASKELSDLEYDYSVENQKEALDNEYDRYEEIIQKKIKSITDYLSQSGTITADAMALLASGTDTFYNSLLAWNKKFGTGVDEDIIGKWKLAIDWVGKYKDAVDGLGVKPLPAGSSPSTDPIGYGTYGGIDGNPNTPYHSGGWVGGKPTLASNEEYAKLMDGEYVATKGMISNFMGNTLPSMISGGRGETPTIHLEFNIAGALDRSVIPDIKAIATQVIGQINNTMNSRGYLRSSNQTAS